ncbi:T9SS type A sorting domain-containing protein [Catalinimonas alkaloidigena]|uniref:T9SS type A sorting domain-containing protein n=1 Tax=Catalinimonas alkaloidigena TaxID=1075417 RepID=UPI002406EF1F|nr:T9SS type A sorting domain-containing protein [Catalinimonas alkaloidigena]
MSNPIIAQDLTSKNNTLGNWKANGTWVEGSIPGNNGEENSSVHIYGKVTLEDNLVLDNNNHSEIYDTLWVQGDVTIRPGSSLTIKPDGVLIISGVLYMRGGTLTNQGISVLIDRYDVRGGNLINNLEFYVFDLDNSYYGGVGTISSSDPEGFRDDDNLELNHNSLFNQIANGTLPIKLLSFTGQANMSSIQLDWITAFEENFDYFTVERAGADLKFKAIGNVNGTGDSTAEIAYDFTDTNPLQGQAFYRLKATDYDGSVEYHKIISVHYSGFTARVNNTTVYPNPVTNHTLTVISDTEMEEIRLMDFSGRTVYKQTARLDSNKFSLPSSVKPGAYLLIVLSNNGKQHQQKIMVI